MSNFTAQQEYAIRWLRQDACVVAGPGSGKTSVLVERYRSLVEDHHVDPAAILAITFTEKAAANMKAKLAEQFAHNAVLQRDIESAWVSTIHGFCARLLRENAIAAGIDPRFAVLDARESEDMQFECMTKALDEITEHRRPEALELIDALQTPHIAGALQDAYDAIRSAGRMIAEVRAMPSPTTPVEPAQVALRLLRNLNGWSSDLTPVRRLHREELIEWARLLAEPEPLSLAEFLARADDRIKLNKVPPSEKDDLKVVRELLDNMVASFIDRHMASQRALIFDVLARFEELYQDRKNGIGALDFNDLERRSIELLLHAETRDRVRRKFRQVMLDEFQDINEQQSRLIELVRDEDVFFAVGDPNQSIYAFRHARPEIFHEYRESIELSGKHSTELTHNFRSRDEILRTVKQLLDNAEGIVARDLIAAASFTEKDHPSVEVLKVIGADKDEASAREARWIAHRILSLHGVHDFADFAVLCRNSESMGAILKAFEDSRIPYVCGRRQSFLLSREGLDLTALLHVIANPRDTIALATVLRSPLVGIGDEALLRLKLLAGTITGGLNTGRFADFDPEDTRKLEAFTANLKRWRAEQPVVPLEVLISRMLGDAPITDNIESFLRLARTRGEGRDLPSFLREIESLRKAVNTESELSDADQGNCVQVMTAHAAKGLEFKVTVIAAMEKGTQRDSAAVTFTPAVGLGLKWAHPSDKDGIGDTWQQANREALRQREKEESNRLLYVAMTRAEEHLILSYAVADRKPSNWAKLVDELYQPPALTEDPPPLDAADLIESEEEVRIIPRPVIVDQHDSTVNVTSLAVFAQCPRKYYLQRYIGWNWSPVGSYETPAADLGTLVHDLLAGKPGDYPAQATELAAVFQRSDLGLRAAASPRVFREWDFILDIDGSLVRGVIDLWFEQDGQIHIVDYKTDSKVEPSHYSPQLAIYALALERAFGRRPAHAWLHFLRFDQLVEVPIDYAAVHQLIARLRAAQDTLSFDLNEGPDCRSCAFYRGLCPALWPGNGILGA